MTTWHWLDSFKTFYNKPWVRYCLLTVYYLAIITGLIILYGKGDFSSPPFVYQGF
jgi:hypothetical protein